MGGGMWRGGCGIRASCGGGMWRCCCGRSGRRGRWRGCGSWRRGGRGRSRWTIRRIILRMRWRSRRWRVGVKRLWGPALRPSARWFDPGEFRGWLSLVGLMVFPIIMVWNRRHRWRVFHAVMALGFSFVLVIAIRSFGNGDALGRDAPHGSGSGLKLGAGRCAGAHVDDHDDCGSGGMLSPLPGRAFMLMSIPRLRRLRRLAVGQRLLAPTGAEVPAILDGRSSSVG